MAPDPATRTGMLAEATMRLEKAVALQGDNADYTYYLGKAYALKGDHPRAADTLKRAVALDGGRKESLTALSRELFLLGSVADARFCLDRVLGTDGSHPGARILSAEIALREKNWASAEESSRVALRAEWNPAAFSLLVQALYRLRKYGDILAEAGKYPALPVSDTTGTAIFFLGRSHERVGQYRKAFDAYQSLEGTCDHLEFHYHLGRAQVREEKFSDARDHLTRVVAEENPLRAQGHLQRGHALIRLGRENDAIQDYRAAYQLDPRHPDILAAAGKIDLRQGDLVAAGEKFSAALSLDPGHYFARMGRALIHERRGEFGAAIEIYRAIAPSHDRPAVRRRLGICSALKGDYREAIAILGKVRAGGDAGDGVTYYLGYAHAQLGDYPAAIQAWEDLARRAGEHPVLRSNLDAAYHHRARALVEQKQLDAAITACEAYLKRCETDSSTRRNLAALYLNQVLQAIRQPFQVESMVQTLGRARELDPGNEMILFYGALFGIRQGKYEVATRDLRDLLARRGNDGRLLYHLGVTLLASGDIAGLKLLSDINQGAYAVHAATILAHQYLARGDWARTREILAPHVSGTTGTPSLAAVGGASRDTAGVPVFTVSLYVTALMKEGHYQDAEAVIQHYIGRDEKGILHYLGGLIFLDRRDYERAGQDFRIAYDKDPANKTVKGLLARVLFQQANEKLRRGSWEEAASIMGSVLELQPEDPAIEGKLSAYKNFLPISYLKSGNRAKSAGLWEEEQKKDPGNYRTTHTLALLYYWWVLDLEERRRTGAVAEQDKNLIGTLWTKTFSNFVMLKYSDGFWKEWRSQREKVYSGEEVPVHLGDEDLKVLRNRPLERMSHHLHELRKQYLAENRQDEIERIDRYLLLLEVERQSASRFNSFMTRVGGSPRDRVLPVCGAAMLRHLGGCEQFRDVLREVRRVPSEEALAEELSLLMSPLGAVMILIDKNKLQEASRELQALSSEQRSSRPGLRTQAALARAQGRAALETDPTLSLTLNYWEEAMRFARDRSQIGAIQDDIIKACIEAAKRMNDKERFEDAINVLERGKDIVGTDSGRQLPEHLAYSYSMRGNARIKADQLDQAESDFKKALEYQSDYQRAREGLATVYNNRGVECANREDLDEAIRLLERAMGYVDTQNVRKNLGRVYYSKAVSLSNSRYSSPLEVISYLRKAAETDPSEEKYRTDFYKMMNALGRR